MTNINLSNNATFSNCSGMGDATTNTLNANHLFSGIMLLNPPSGGGLSASNQKFFGVGRNLTAVRWWNGTPQTTANLFMEWGNRTFRYYQSDGSSILLHVDGSVNGIGIGRTADSNNLVVLPNNRTISFTNAASSAFVRTLSLDTSDIIIFGEGTTNVIRPRVTGIPLGSSSFRWDIFALSGSASIDFASIAAQSCLNDTFTLTGAATGDGLAPAWPSALTSDLIGMMFVSATNTVTVRLCNPTAAAIDPASLTYGARLIR
jgi:hypothetical protein